jgi:hypothetical protein
MKTTPTQLFLTGADHHSPRPLEGRRLRAYVMRHALFFDQLLIGDSQMNNNAALRHWIWDQEEPLTAPPKGPRDLSELLAVGQLVPVVRRDYPSLEDLRKEHVNRNVEDVPTEAYVHFITSKLDGKRVNYGLPAVSSMFKQRVEDAFAEPSTRGSGRLSENTQKRFYEYVVSQEPLLWRSVRDWLDDELRAGRLTERNRSFIDRIVGARYFHNIPLTLDTNIDFPVSSGASAFPIDIRLGNTAAFERMKQQGHQVHKRVIRPAVFLSMNWLADLPAGVVTTLKAHNRSKAPLESYKTISRCLEQYRRSGELESLDRFAEALTKYFDEVDLVWTECLNGQEKSAYLRMQAKCNWGTAIRLISGLGAAVLSISSENPNVHDAANALHVIHAGAGGLHEISEAAKTPEGYLRAYIMGRATKRERPVLGIVR